MSELIDVPQPNWLKAWELIWGCRPRWPVYVIVWCNVWVDDPQPNWQCNWLKAWELIWGCRPRLPVYVIVWCNVWVDDPQPNWQCNWLKAWELIWGWRPRLPVYIIVWCYVGVDVTQPNWHKACNENCFGEVDQDDMFILQSNAMSELMSSTLTGIKTAECLSGEKAKYFVYSVIRVL